MHNRGVEHLAPKFSQALRAELAAYLAYRNAVEAGLWARVATAHATGVPTDEIAETLGLSSATVKRRIAEVMGVTDVTPAQD